MGSEMCIRDSYSTYTYDLCLADTCGVYNIILYDDYGSGWDNCGSASATITDPNGNVIAQSSSGANGFKGSRKSTPFAAQLAGETAARKAMDNGMQTIEVYVKGAGSGREAAVRALQATGLSVTAIRDVTPLPHNGCRPRKERRV